MSYYGLGDCLVTTPKDRVIVHIPCVRRDYFTVSKQCAKPLGIVENNRFESSWRDTINIVDNIDKGLLDSEIVDTEIVPVSKKHTGYKICSIDLNR